LFYTLSKKTQAGGSHTRERHTEKSVLTEIRFLDILFVIQSGKAAMIRAPCQERL